MFLKITIPAVSQLERRPWSCYSIAFSIKNELYLKPILVLNLYLVLKMTYISNSKFSQWIAFLTMSSYNRLCSILKLCFEHTIVSFFFFWYINSNESNNFISYYDKLNVSIKKCIEITPLSDMWLSLRQVLKGLIRIHW